MGERSPLDSGPKILSFFADLDGTLSLAGLLGTALVQGATGQSNARPALYYALLTVATLGIGGWIVTVAMHRIRRREPVETERAARPEDPCPATNPRPKADRLDGNRSRKAFLAAGALVVGVLAAIAAQMIGGSQDSSPPSKPSARGVLFETFEDRPAGDWSSTRIETADGRRRFLGRFSGEDTADLKVSDLPPHESVHITVDLFVIGSWDGTASAAGYGPDHFQVKVDSFRPVFDATFTNSGPGSPISQSYPLQHGDGECSGESGSSEVDTLGYEFRGSPHDSVYRITVTAAHSADVVRIRFGGFGLTSPPDDPLSDESWGLDNVLITTSSQPPPETTAEWAESCELLDRS